MLITYGSSVGIISDQLVGEIESLSASVFGGNGDSEGDWRFKHMPDFSLFEARAENRLVGFKIGYAHTKTRYYSWLGAVNVTFRRNGIARELMIRQHLWLCERGYLSVETAARHSNFAMAQLNLASGFKVVGIRYKGEDPDIIYEKSFV